MGPTPRRRTMRALLVALAALLLLGQAALALHHGLHSSPAQGCDACAIQHSGGALAPPIAAPAAPPSPERELWLHEAAGPIAPSLDRPTARAPPLAPPAA